MPLIDDHLQSLMTTCRPSNSGQPVPLQRPLATRPTSVPVRSQYKCSIARLVAQELPTSRNVNVSKQHNIVNVSRKLKSDRVASSLKNQCCTMKLVVVTIRSRFLWLLSDLSSRGDSHRRIRNEMQCSAFVPYMSCLYQSHRFRKNVVTTSSKRACSLLYSPQWKAPSQIHNSFGSRAA